MMRSPVAVTVPAARDGPRDQPGGLQRGAAGNGERTAAGQSAGQDERALVDRDRAAGDVDRPERQLPAAALADHPRAADRPGVGAVRRLVEHQRGVVGNAPLQAGGGALERPGGDRRAAAVAIVLLRISVPASEGHTPLNLEYLRRLCALPDLSDDAMADEFHLHRLISNAAPPSVETLSHASLPAKYIDHTHADAILVLTNQPEGDKLIREALGEGVALVDYVKPGFKLAKAVIAAYDANPGCRALVWMQHGIMTWGETAREAYSSMIDLVTRAEEFAARRASKPLVVVMPASLADAEERLGAVAPVVRGLLAQPSGDPRPPVPPHGAPANGQPGNPDFRPRIGQGVGPDSHADFRPLGADQSSAPVGR